MRAVIHSRYGNAEVLQVTTLERPVPQKNEVLVRVKAAGLDYGQWHLMAGKPYAMRLATGLTRPRQRVLGMDVSGVVEAVGAEVTRFKVGDAVFGAASRTFAEFTCAREDQLCLKPERLSFEQAGATAIHGLYLNPATAPAMKTAAIATSDSMTPLRPSTTANAR